MRRKRSRDPPCRLTNSVNLTGSGELPRLELFGKYLIYTVSPISREREARQGIGGSSFSQKALTSDWQKHPAECARKRDAAPAALSDTLFSTPLQMRQHRAPTLFALKDPGTCGNSTARRFRRGFTTLEAMISVALLGMFLVTAYEISARITRHQADAVVGFQDIAMARAVLDEYSVTYPEMLPSGTYKDTWEWKITETPQPALEPSEYDDLFEFIRVTVEIRRRHSERDPVHYFKVVSKRRQGQ